MRAAARRVRLHERVSGGPHVRGLAGPAHLWRHQRDHEGVDLALDLAPDRRCGVTCGGAMRADADTPAREAAAGAPAARARCARPLRVPAARAPIPLLSQGCDAVLVPGLLHRSLL